MYTWKRRYKCMMIDICDYKCGKLIVQRELFSSGDCRQPDTGLTLDPSVPRCASLPRYLDVLVSSWKFGSPVFPHVASLESYILACYLSPGCYRYGPSHRHARERVNHPLTRVYTYAYPERIRGTSVAPVYTTFIRVYVNATKSSARARAHVLLPPSPPLLLLRLLLSLTTNLPFL